MLDNVSNSSSVGVGPLPSGVQGSDLSDLVARNSTRFGVDPSSLAADIGDLPSNQRSQVLGQLSTTLTPTQHGELLGALDRQSAADKPRGLQATSAAAPAKPDADKLARSLVQAGGSGTKEDVERVVAELKKMPTSALQTLKDSHTNVIACRNSVTDYAADLKGVRPRGWPPGKTWDNVPGAYLPDRNTVVFGVIGHGTKEGPHIARTGEGHGSANLVVHETTHAIDAHIGQSRNSRSQDFSAARAKDVAALPAYELQKGLAGPSETYAESSARFYGGSHASIKTPALDNYWRSHPLGNK